MARDFAKIGCNNWVGFGPYKALRGRHKELVLYMFLQSCPQSNGIGIYPVGPKAMEEGTGLDELDITTCLAQLQVMGLVRYDAEAEYVWVKDSAMDTYGSVVNSGSKAWYALIKELHTHKLHPYVGEFVSQWAAAYDLDEDSLLSTYTLAKTSGAQEIVGNCNQEEHGSEENSSGVKYPNYETTLSRSRSLSRSKSKKKVSPEFLADCLEVWDTWVGLLGDKRGPKPTFDTKRKKLLAARLKEGHTKDTLLAAAKGIFASRWHQENQQVRFELCFRDTEHVERFAGEAAKFAPPKNSGPQLSEWAKEAKLHGWQVNSSGEFAHPKYSQLGWITEEKAREIEFGPIEKSVLSD